MTPQEIEEYELWIKHNDLCEKIIFLMETSKSVSSISKEIRHEKLYLLLYFYVEIVDKIKEIYR